MSSKKGLSLKVIQIQSAAKFWSKIANDKNKKTEKTTDAMQEEKPKKEIKPKTVKELLKLNKKE